MDGNVSLGVSRDAQCFSGKRHGGQRSHDVYAAYRHDPIFARDFDAAAESQPDFLGKAIEDSYNDPATRRLRLRHPEYFERYSSSSDANKSRTRKKGTRKPTLKNRKKGTPTMTNDCASDV